MSSDEIGDPGHAPPPTPEPWPPPPSPGRQPGANKELRWVGPFVTIVFVLGAAGVGYWVLQSELTERAIERTGVEFIEAIAAGQDLTPLLDDDATCAAPEVFRQPEPVVLDWSPYANVYALRADSASSFGGNSTTLDLRDIRLYEEGRPHGTDYGLAYGELDEAGEVTDLAVLVTREPGGEWMACDLLRVEE